MEENITRHEFDAVMERLDAENGKRAAESPAGVGGERH